MNISGITNGISNITSKVGKTIAGNDKAQKFIKNFEPIGGDNTFFGLGTIMLSAVLLPRIITASKRNPDNKEATKDEISEILFRDVQTILIMLFGLKMLNSGIGNIATKLTGIPMVNKPFKKMFNSTEEGFKGIQEKAGEFFKNPIEKGKIALENVGMLLNPIGGSRLSTAEEMEDLFTTQDSFENIKKFFNEIPNRGGDKEKVFNRIMDSLIEGQEKEIAKETQSCSCRGADKADVIELLEKIKEQLVEVKNEGVDKFIEQEECNKAIENLMTNFFKDKDNTLARSSRNVKDWLRTIALAIEVIYLGFGLPALNQKRLEKKYLSDKPIGTQNGDTFTPINNKHIKAQEIKLYSNFIK